MKTAWESEHDYIVVGGGTSGAIMAARLAQGGASVLLLEAGEDFPDEKQLPPALVDPEHAVMRGFNWDLQAVLRPAGLETGAQRSTRIARVFQIAGATDTSPQTPRPAAEPSALFSYPLAKVMGGGSAINGAVALHSSPEDYDAWAERGNDWWSYRLVEPHLRALECETRERPALPIKRTDAVDCSPTQRAFLESCALLGMPALRDEGDGAPGAGTVPRNIRHGARASTATLYLSRARGRQTLRICARAHVERLLISSEGGSMRARGVEATLNGEPRCFRGGHVVLCAGAIGSPAILLRSGIGPAPELRRLDIRVVQHLAGVGINLLDHPAVCLWAIPKPELCVLSEPLHQAMLRTASTGSSRCDLQLFMLSPVSTALFPPLQQVSGASVALGISVALAIPTSTGTVSLVSANPSVAPRIELNCLGERHDMKRMLEGVRLAWRILNTRPLAERIERVLWEKSLVGSDENLESVVRSSVRTLWHPAGTARMGPESDAMAVVNQLGRVHGISDLTIADASVMPCMPSAPPNLTCMVIAERIADGILGRAGPAPRTDVPSERRPDRSRNRS